MPIVYKDSMRNFHRDLDVIPDRLADPGVNLAAYRRTAQYRSWRNSLAYMSNMLRDADVRDDCGVLIEFKLPSTSRRIDFIVTGCDRQGAKNFVIVELKQWDRAEPVPDKEGVVLANVAGSVFKETSHPCYQAWSYQLFLENMLDSVRSNHLHAAACAYMHNYPYDGIETDPLARPPNRQLVEQTPLFGMYDRLRLGRFISERVGCGDGEEIMQLLADGKVVPSTRLVDMVTNLFDESSPRSFTLIDEQKVAFETIMSAVRTAAAHGHEKTCVIIKGGPGTGKSVVAMSAFARMLREFRDDEHRRNICFVSPTASFRTVMMSMLVGKGRKRSDRERYLAYVGSLFKSGMCFFEAPAGLRLNRFPANQYHCLIVDEAHRLHSVQNMYRGSNQIEDVINAARVSVFFVDDNQALRPYDIGSEESITAAAQKYRARVVKEDLSAQFRCRGSDGFLNWLAEVLGLEEAGSTANADGWDQDQFDFDVVDTPEEVLAFVREKNARAAGEHQVVQGRSVFAGARLLAGYAWPWTRENNLHAEVKDVDLGTVKLAWNNRAASYKWATDPGTMDEVGCVHTSQGLEFDWVGVFIGNDLRYDPEKKRLYADIDSYFDKGGKNGLGKTKQERSRNLLKYVCRCYRVLLSRGVHGARVYCCDKALSEYLKARLAAVRSR